MFIKRATGNDLGTIVELGKRLYYETYLNQTPEEILQKYIAGELDTSRIARFLKSPDHLVLILCRPSPKGYMIVEVKNNIATIDKFYIDRKLGGRGNGRKMLNLAIGWLKNKGVHNVTVSVFHRNLSAIFAYQRLGFRTTGGISYCKDGLIEKGFTMQRSL